MTNTHNASIKSLGAIAVLMALMPICPLALIALAELTNVKGDVVSGSYLGVSACGEAQR
jgi:hypothetical protein